MRKCAVMFAVISLLLTFAIVFYNSEMKLLEIIANDKMIQFVILNSILLLGVGIFFGIFHSRLKLYLENYRREKEI